MRWIYLSPHLDDAVLSCGGLIAEQRLQKLEVEVWTIFAGMPSEQAGGLLATYLHARWGFANGPQAVRERIEEDRRALSMLPAKPRYFPFLDCIYRQDQDGQPLYENIFSPLHPAESDLPARIAAVLQEHLGEDDVLVSPLAIGAHIDHVIVRQASEMLARPLWGYAEVPYLFRSPQELEEKTQKLQSVLFPVSFWGKKAWLSACGAYHSQIGELFDSEEAMQKAMQEYAERENGIRLWKIKEESPAKSRFTAEFTKYTEN
ncbi:MAG: PIG-L deacetylase family protein [Anaerolineales bacterium]